MSSKLHVALVAVGAFNPATNAHLKIFELAKDHLHKLGSFSVLGGIISPVHDAYSKKNLASAVHRLEMCQRSVSSSSCISVSDWEIPPIWASHIVGPAKEEEAEKLNVKLVCGADLLESFAIPNLWLDEDIDHIVGHHGMVVISRAGSCPEKFIYDSDALTQNKNNIFLVTEWITNEISSTKIRRALQRKENIAAKMHGHNKFSKLDATSWYLMLALTEKPSLVTTFNTPFGRYKYKRMPFGLICAQDQFQRKMEETFGNLKGVGVIVDDILVSGNFKIHSKLVISKLSPQRLGKTNWDEDLPAEFHPPVTQSSSPKKAAPKTPDNRSTGEIIQDSPYRTPRTPTPPLAANIESRNGEDYSRPYVTRTGRVVKPRKIMDI
ncbi:hypothetical protein QYM36_006817 [Artemia franciscana]|uniref:Cytidyltransferase-like domain-containing protein n=1 Tax=Artemia franciscana TaxID=6661 RepID=A0AA88HUG8_ARTSF|nr:hypothetical protein QYM36_006817 [Artemia franciscana]